jgi:hypothetical protein
VRKSSSYELGFPAVNVDSIGRSHGKFCSSDFLSGTLSGVGPQNSRHRTRVSKFKTRVSEFKTRVSNLDSALSFFKLGLRSRIFFHGKYFSSFSWNFSLENIS